MQTEAWQSAPVDLKTFAEARIQAANTVHWLARAAHSYLDHEPDHRHLWLRFDPLRCAFRTRSFAEGVSVELRLPALELQFREGEKLVPHTLHVEGHSPAKVEAWLLVELLHRGIDRDRFSKALPYEPQNLMSGDHVEFSPDASARDLDVLTGWLAGADNVIGQVARRENSDPNLICWPEQFHLGVLLPPAPGSPAGDKALRVALSLGDERTPEPHYIVAVQNGSSLETPHPVGMLTASRIAADRMSPEAVVDALQAAIATTRRRLAN